MNSKTGIFLTLPFLFLFGVFKQGNAQADTTTYEHSQILVFNSDVSRKAMQPDYVFLFPSRLQSEGERVKSLGLKNVYDVVDEMERNGWRLIDTDFALVPSLGITLQTNRFYFRRGRFR